MCNVPMDNKQSSKCVMSQRITGSLVSLCTVPKNNRQPSVCNVPKDNRESSVCNVLKDNRQSNVCNVPKDNRESNN